MDSMFTLIPGIPSLTPNGSDILTDVELKFKVNRWLFRVGHHGSGICGLQPWGRSFRCPLGRESAMFFDWRGWHHKHRDVKLDLLDFAFNLSSITIVTIVTLGKSSFVWWKQPSAEAWDGQVLSLKHQETQALAVLGIFMLFSAPWITQPPGNRYRYRWHKWISERNIIWLPSTSLSQYLSKGVPCLWIHRTMSSKNVSWTSLWKWAPPLSLRPFSRGV